MAKITKASYQFVPFAGVLFSSDPIATVFGDAVAWRS